jgi:hypothetical protein
VTALSPALSWLVFGAVVGFAVAVYLLASAWLDRQDPTPKTWTSTNPEDAHIRIIGGVYDAEARGDFE